MQSFDYISKDPVLCISIIIEIIRAFPKIPRIPRMPRNLAHVIGLCVSTFVRLNEFIN